MLGIHTPVLNLGAHVAPLGMKFYTGERFPADYKSNILIAEHGSWNRHEYQGDRIMRVIVGPDGKNAKQEFRIWLDRRRPGYLGRPNDILLDEDGSNCSSPTIRPARSIASATRSQS